MPPSNDREGLLAAIHAAPGDDVPRLVYADWLDEHGDATDQARARFIRLQIESERLDGAGRMAKEANRPPRGDKSAFLQGLPVGKGFAIYFRRGMPEDAVAKTAGDFVRRADAAFAAA